MNRACPTPSHVSSHHNRSEEAMNEHITGFYKRRAGADDRHHELA